MDNKLNRTKNKFIEKSNLIHNGFYNYDKVNYITANTKVIITCPMHGDFEQLPSNHNRGQKCPRCAHANSLNKTDDFLSLAIKTHGSFYNYDKVNYVNNNTRVIITCPFHGDFEQTPVNHNRGRGCPDCGLNKKITSTTKQTSTFISESNVIHNNFYDYSKTVYLHSEEEIIITCPEHGDFQQLAFYHLRGYGCKDCKNKIKFDDIVNNFITYSKYLHENFYNYDKVIYISTKEKVIITCPVHGDFEQLPNNHQQGQGCPQCSFEKTISKAEQEIVDYLKSLNINNIITSDRTLLSNKEIDIYLPDYNLAIEFNGLYWHSEIKKDNKNYHLEKTNECNNLGIQLIHIFEDEWLNKKDIVKSRLCNLLGKNTNKIYGRETIVKVIDNKQYRTFIDNNHLQGYVAGKIYLGLFYTSKDTNKEYLVSVMSFGSLRKNLGNTSKDNHYELLRFSNSKYINVIGGASKLLKYFEKHYNPEYIISYADKRWSKGNLYQQLNFELIRESIPNYFYVKGLSRENRYNYRKDILVSKYGCSPEMTERQFMQEVMNMNRIYDCGNYVFEKIYNIKII